MRLTFTLSLRNAVTRELMSQISTALTSAILESLLVALAFPIQQMRTLVTIQKSHFGALCAQVRNPQ